MPGYRGIVDTDNIVSDYSRSKSGKKSIMKTVFPGLAFTQPFCYILSIHFT